MFSPFLFHLTRTSKPVQQPKPPHSRGFLNRIKPLSRQEAVASFSNENIAGTCKTQIANHIKKFFEESSVDKNSILAQFGKGSTRYVTDKDFDPESDKTKVKLTVRKFFEEIKNEIPCIIVSTSGITFKPSGLGYSDGAARLDNGVLTTVHHVVREVAIVILIVTQAQEDTERLYQVIQMMFGDLSGITSGYSIYGNKEFDRWVIHLPKIPELSNPEKQPMGDSQQSFLWSATVGLNITYEDNVYITMEEDKYTVGSDFVEEPTINFPSKLYVGRKTLGSISGLRVGQKVMLSDPTLATLQAGDSLSEFILLGKKPGNLKVWIVQGVDNNTEGSKNFFRPNVVVEHSITIQY